MRISHYLYVLLVFVAVGYAAATNLQAIGELEVRKTHWMATKIVAKVYLHLLARCLLRCSLHPLGRGGKVTSCPGFHCSR